MIEKAKLESKIGKIVTLKSNHLKTLEQYESIFLGGEPTFITPLMVIKEVLKLNSDKVDEDSGKIKNAKGNMQFRCIWFSNKSFKFEEAWFFENELDFLVFEEKEVPTLRFGDNVVLKTNHLELKKRKTSLEIDKEKANNKASALLNFCSPVFIHLGYANVEKKESLIDPNNGEPKRAYCSKLVKLKAFNVKEDKYSEFLVPVEAVEKIKTIDQKIIKQYLDAKENNSLLAVYHQVEENKEIVNKIFNVLSFTSISNIYKVEIKNVFTNDYETIEIKNSDVELITDTENYTKYPQIHQLKKEFKIKSIEDYLREILKNNVYLEEEKIDENYINNLKAKKLVKIVYKNKFEKVTTRFCIPIFFFSVTTKKYNSKEEKETSISEHYVQSFCLYRNDYRNFKVERIMSLELIENDVLNDFASQNWLAFVKK